VGYEWYGREPNTVNRLGVSDSNNIDPGG